MRQRGFSMIEMAITMAVLGLLLAAAMPSGSSWIRNMRLRANADSMQSGLQRARLEAIRRNTSVSFWLVSLSASGAMDNNCTLASSGNSWVVSQDSPAGACGTAPSTTTAPRIVISHSSAEGNGQALAVTATQLDGTTPAKVVTFNGLGRVLSTAADGTMPFATINVKYTTANSNDRPLRIVVSSAGMVVLCDPSLSSPTQGYCPTPS